MPSQLVYRKRGRLVHHEMIIRDYFWDNLVYDAVQFRTWFKMSRRLFLKVIEAVCGFNSYFVQRVDATGTLGLSNI